MTNPERWRAFMVPPIPAPDMAPFTLVRSAAWPKARGLFVGTSPAGVLWVAWRRCAAVNNGVPESIESWHGKARAMATNLDRHRVDIDDQWRAN